MEYIFKRRSKSDPSQGGKYWMSVYRLITDTIYNVAVSEIDWGYITNL